MTMVSTGEISIGGNATSGGLNRSVNIELGRSATATSSLNESALRTLAGVPTGAISLSNFYGKANAFAFTISSNQVNANLRTLAVNAGWNQSSAVQATVAAGVYIYSTSTSTPGLTINGSFPGGVTLTNNGFIMGMGGDGGAGEFPAGNAGGPAISLGVNCSIVNNSYIGGGGGGGATFQGGGGGGAGGGNGAAYSVAGGSGGGPGSSGSNGNVYYAPKGPAVGAGGGGGRIMPGLGGSGGTFYASTEGKGGGAGGGGGGSGYPANGGNGGSGGNPAGATPYPSGGGGGGWGASGGPAYYSNYPGGAGGKAINLNGFTANRTGSGTTYGTVS